MYIGQTTNFKNRFRGHKSDLRLNKHSNFLLQKSCNKYGLEELVFKRIICCKKEDLDFFEQLFFDTYKPSYNICMVANSPMSNPETVKKASKTRIRNNKNRSPEQLDKKRKSHPKNKRVLNLDTGEIYHSVNEASRSLKSGRSCVYNCLMGKADKHNLKYVDNPELNIIAENNRVKRVTKREKNYRPVICLCTGIRYKSISSASTKSGVNIYLIEKGIRNPSKKSGGLYWRYEDEKIHNKYLQIEKEKVNPKHWKTVVCLDTGQEFFSAAEAARNFNVSISAICNCCKRKNGTCLGKRFIYKESKYE